MTFGFAVPIKTDVKSQTPAVCFQEGRVELWIIVALFIQNWKRQTAECSLINSLLAHVRDSTGREK